VILFLLTAAALLTLLAVMPFWAGTGFQGVPVLTLAVLAVGVVLSAIFGRTPRD
jgi:hypothetical protein